MSDFVNDAKESVRKRKMREKVISEIEKVINDSDSFSVSSHNSIRIKEGLLDITGSKIGKIKKVIYDNKVEIFIDRGKVNKNTDLEVNEIVSRLKDIFKESEYDGDDDRVREKLNNITINIKVEG